jgi:hypothetical protein
MPRSAENLSVYVSLYIHWLKAMAFTVKAAFIKLVPKMKAHAMVTANNDNNTRVQTEAEKGLIPFKTFGNSFGFPVTNMTSSLYGSIKKSTT